MESLAEERTEAMWKLQQGTYVHIQYDYYLYLLILNY